MRKEGEKNIFVVIIMFTIFVLLTAWFFYEISKPKSIIEDHPTDEDKIKVSSCLGFLVECDTDESCDIKCSGLKYNQKCFLKKKTDVRSRC